MSGDTWLDSPSCTGYGTPTVFKRYYQILAPLVMDRDPVLGQALYCNKKLKGLERLFVSLFLVKTGTRSRLDRSIQPLESLGQTCSRDEARLNLLKGLKDLLDYWVPFVLMLGT